MIAAALHITIHALTFALLIATVLPLIRTGAWWVRLWDFPRVQLSMLAGVVLLTAALAVWRDGWRKELVLSMGLLVAVGTWHIVHILPYTSIWPTEVTEVTTSRLRLLVCNLDVRNRRHADVRDMIARTDADLVLVIEISDAWNEALADVRDRYPHRMEKLRGDGLGIALWSRWSMDDADVNYLVSDRRPSIHSRICLSQGRRIRFIGLHPTPPALPVEGEEDRYDSRIRDAELMKVAELVSSDPEATWVVAGDYNDVAWSRTTRLFQRESGLLDPRKGRRLLNTFHARYPLLRYPLDHVFVSSDVGVSRFDRVRTPGSDHFAVLVELDLLGGREAEDDSASTPDDRSDQAERIIEEGQDDATERGE